MTFFGAAAVQTSNPVDLSFLLCTESLDDFDDNNPSDTSERMMPMYASPISPTTDQIAAAVNPMERLNSSKRLRAGCDPASDTIPPLASIPVGNPISPEKAPVSLRFRTSRSTGQDAHRGNLHKLVLENEFLQQASQRYMQLFCEDMEKNRNTSDADKQAAYIERASNYYNRSCDADNALEATQSLIPRIL